MNSCQVTISFSVLEGTSERITMEIPKLPMTFTGTGDLFTSMFLSWMYKTKGKLKESLEKTIASLQAVIKRTAGSLGGKQKYLHYCKTASFVNDKVHGQFLSNIEQ